MNDRLIEDLRDFKDNEPDSYHDKLIEQAIAEIERLRGVEARYEWLKASSPGGCWWSEYAPSEKDFDAMVDYGIATSRSAGAADVGEDHG